MSKLFDDASLAMIPSAYKDGKLYSIRPTDGSGDFTFSRGSNLAATRVDVNGLIEKGRENLFLHSEDVSNSAYAKIGVNATYNQIANPVNGSVTADKLITNGDANVEHMVRVTNYITTGVKTLSVYVKYINYQYVYLRELANNKYAVYDIQNGVVTREDAASSQISTNIESVGNGWYRLSMTFLVTSITNNLIDVGLSYSDTSFAGSMSAGSEAYFYGFQLEAGLVATDYIETGASTAQAGILEDMPRLDYSGSCPALLLEPQRTNLIGYSEYFEASEWTYYNSTISSNNSTSPDGFENATRWTSTASGTFLTESLSVSDPSNFSVFVKYVDHPYMLLYSGASGGFYASFDIQNNIIGTSGYNTSNEKIESYGNGWYRISCTFTGVSGGSTARIGFARSLTSTWGDLNTSAAGDVLIYGATFEAGSYPTSYIPTYGSSVTRSKDNCLSSSLTASTDFTIFFEAPDFCLINGSTGGVFANIQFVFSSNGAAYNTLGSYHIYNNSLYYWDGGANTSFGVIYNNQTDSKFALVKRGDSMIVFANGSKVNEVTLPSGSDSRSIYWDTISLSEGSLTDGSGNVFNPYYKQVAKFDTALTDSECIALTTL